MLFCLYLEMLGSIGQMRTYLKQEFSFSCLFAFRFPCLLRVKPIKHVLSGDEEVEGNVSIAWGSFELPVFVLKLLQQIWGVSQVKNSGHVFIAHMVPVT